MHAPSLQTVKRLFAESGNVCAFEGCTQALVVEAAIVGDICHICAASPGGPRFDARQSEEERASYANLLLLCATHHRVIDADLGTYTTAAVKQLKLAHAARNKSPSEITDAVALAAIASSGFVIGAITGSAVSINQSGGQTGDTSVSVTSHNQQGGITAHTVNHAPAPELRILSQSATTEGEWSNTRLVIEVVSPYPAANLYLEAKSDGIEEFDVSPMRSGVFSFGTTGTRAGFCFTNVQQAYGKYAVGVRSKSRSVQLIYSFE